MAPGKAYAGGAANLATLAYTAPGTGTVPTNLAEWMGRTVNGWDYFLDAQRTALKAGTPTDITTRLQTAMTQAPSGAHLWFPRAPYKITGSSPIVRTSDVWVTFEPGSTIDITGYTGSSNGALTFQGSAGTPVSLTSAITAGDITITVPSSIAAAAQPGSVYLITTYGTYGGDGTQWVAGNGSSWPKGELVEVLTSDGTSTLRLKSPTYDSYGATGVRIVPITPIQVVLEGINLVGARSSNIQAGVRVTWGKDVRILGGNITGCSWGNYVVENCLGGVIDSVTGGDNYTSSGGYNYGICFSSSQNFRVIAPRLMTGRHTITCGGFWPTRDIRVLGGDLDSDPRLNVWTIDAHANAEKIYVEHCRIGNGIALGARSAWIRSSTITGRNISAIYRNSGGTVPVTNGLLVLEDVDLECPVNGGSNNYGVYIYDQGTFDGIYLDNVRVKAYNSPNAVAIVGYSGQSLTVNNFYASNVRGFANAGNFFYFDNVTIPTTRFAQNDTTLNANNYHYLWGSGARLTNLWADGSNMTTNATNGGVFTIPATAQVQNVFINRLSFINPASTTYTGPTITATNFIQVKDSYLQNLNGTAWNLTAPDIQWVDVRHQGVTGTTTLNGRAYATVVDAAGHVVTYGTAAPVRGVWKIGDHWINTASATGTTKGGFATTAGGAYASTRADATAYTVNTWVAWATGTTVYECTTAGTSTTGAPTAATAVGQTVTDGTVVWTCRSLTKAVFTSEGSL